MRPAINVQKAIAAKKAAEARKADEAAQVTPDNVISEEDITLTETAQPDANNLRGVSDKFPTPEPAATRNVTPDSMFPNPTRNEASKITNYNGSLTINSSNEAKNFGLPNTPGGVAVTAAVILSVLKWGRQALSFVQKKVFGADAGAAQVHNGGNNIKQNFDIEANAPVEGATPQKKRLSEVDRLKAGGNQNTGSTPTRRSSPRAIRQANREAGLGH